MNNNCYENSVPQNDPRFNREFAKMFANKQLQVDYDAIKELNRQEVSEIVKTGRCGDNQGEWYSGN